MSKKTALENEINWLRTVIAILSAAIFGLFAWVAHNYKTAAQAEIVTATMMLFLLIIAAIMINKKVYRNIRELEDLED